jgi:ubiquinone/menaquinone biosynthesis C-methylase UbiE
MAKRFHLPEIGLMTTNYDPIAEQYKRSKQQPWRTFVECFTLMKLVGDLDGMDVLDVACGEGFYTRMIRQRGAARVTGVDLSHGMIELARNQEAQHQLGIEYVVGDARELPHTQECDLAVAAYLLNYARNRNEIQAMCDGIARSLKPGGRFITVNCNPALVFSHAPSYRKYGFETSVQGEWREGAPIKWNFYLGDETFEIENYHLNVAIHEEAFRQAGFREVRWHTPSLSPEGLVEYDHGFWSNLLDHPPVAFIECVK